MPLHISISDVFTTTQSPTLLNYKHYTYTTLYFNALLNSYSAWCCWQRVCLSCSLKSWVKLRLVSQVRPGKLPSSKLTKIDFPLRPCYDMLVVSHYRHFGTCRSDLRGSRRQKDEKIRLIGGGGSAVKDRVRNVCWSEGSQPVPLMRLVKTEW